MQEILKIFYKFIFLFCKLRQKNKFLKTYFSVVKNIFYTKKSEPEKIIRVPIFKIKTFFILR